MIDNGFDTARTVAPPAAPLVIRRPTSVRFGDSMDTIANWKTRQWATAAVAGLAVTSAVGIPTDVIPNPVFGRPVDVTWWSYPVLS